MTYSKRTTTTLRKDVLAQLKEAKERLNYSNLNDLLLALLEKSDSVKPLGSVEAVQRAKSPVILTGIPGSGKTTFGRALAEGLAGPLLVVDPHNEFTEIRRMKSAADIYQLDLEKFTGKIRFTPTAAYSRDSEFAFIFQALLQNRDRLKKWSFIIDEGHLLADLRDFRSFVIEARKYVHRIVVICSDARLYEGLGSIMVPPPFEGQGN